MYVVVVSCDASQQPVERRRPFGFIPSRLMPVADSTHPLAMNDVKEDAVSCCVAWIRTLFR